MITKELPLLDDVRDLGRHHDFPGRITRLDFREDIAGEDRQKSVVVVLDALDELILQQVGIEVPEVRRWVQRCMQEVQEVMSCVLSVWLEVVEGGLCSLEVL